MKRLTSAFVCLLALISFSSPALAAQTSVAKAQARANAAAGRAADAETRLAIMQARVTLLRAKAHAETMKVKRLAGVVKDTVVRQFVGDRANDPIFGTTGNFNDDVRRQVLLGQLNESSGDSLVQLEAARRQHKKTNDALENQLTSQLRAVASLKAQQRAAEAELRKLASSIKSSAKKSGGGGGAPPPSGGSFSSTGPWMCPVQGPHSFSDDFGAPRAGHTHQGNDILSPRGTPIVANVSGTVSRHDNVLGGIAYYLEGDDGNEYYGGHLNDFVQGGHVAQGTVIGHVGNTGDASGGVTHLHFEIHPGHGPAVDPYPTLINYC